MCADKARNRLGSLGEFLSTEMIFSSLEKMARRHKVHRRSRNFIFRDRANGGFLSNGLFSRSKMSSSLGIFPPSADTVCVLFSDYRRARQSSNVSFRRLRGECACLSIASDINLTRFPSEKSCRAIVLDRGERQTSVNQVPRNIRGEGQPAS